MLLVHTLKRLTLLVMTFNINIFPNAYNKKILIFKFPFLILFLLLFLLFSNKISVVFSYVYSLNYFYLLQYCFLLLIRILECRELHGSYKQRTLQRCNLAEQSTRYFQITYLVIQLNFWKSNSIIASTNNPSTLLIPVRVLYIGQSNKLSFAYQKIFAIQ